MATDYTGMRKGISLVEMMIAIILFAVLAVISVKYAKNFLNTDMAAKKARIAAVTEQANQLLIAYQVYRAETGMNPTKISDLNTTTGILTEIPTEVTEVAGATNKWGWVAATGITAYPNAFELNISDSANDKRGEEYCAIFNREFNTSVELNVTDGLVFHGTTRLAGYNGAYTKAYCYSSAAQTHHIVVLVP